MESGFRTREIKPIKTVGQRLKAARKKRGLSLEEAEQLTKVKLKYLQALEDDRHDLLPSEVYSLGFLRCYAETLHLNRKKLLEQYRLEHRALRSAKAQPTQVLAPARRIAGPRFLLTPKTLAILGSLALVISLVLYIASGIRTFLASPPLTVSQPSHDIRVTDNTLEVVGQTDPAASLAINGETISLDADGHFKQNVIVVPGLNNLEFVAVSRLGKETRLIRKVLADYQLSAIVSPSPQPSTSGSPAVSPSPGSSGSPSVTPSPRSSPSSLAVSPTPTAQLTY